MAKKKSKTPTTVEDLIFDDKNFNIGNPFGEGLIEKSFVKFGAGRGVLIDKNNRLIAGNKSTQKFAEAGNRKVIVVETTGDTLVVTKRTDIDLDTAQGREMALADNATAKANIVFDAVLVAAEVGEAVCEEWGCTPNTYGDKNAEIDTDSFGNTQIIKLEYSMEDYERVKKALYKHGTTAEAAVIKLLKL